MKALAIISAVLAISVAPLQAKDPQYTNDIVLRGVLDLGDSVNFSLSTPGGQTTHWSKLGEEFQGFEIVSYQRENRTLTVSKDGQEYIVGLGTMTATTGPTAEEEARQEAALLFKNIRFEETLGKLMDSQMEVMSKNMRQQMMAAGNADEETLAFQEKAMAEMFKEVDWKSMQAGIEKAYAEIFTVEELRWMNEFYSTPLGQATIDKAPQLQAKTVEVMMPEIMKASAAMQEKMQTFHTERQETEE
ncbi:DUF2059 domain-containing protein [Cerasicoccus maritimus]|uniref:DUF2059 domain-containing protein n=1 Tax=Cerasicoccus maritimus TaxID=490089 RepID=UPI00285277C4|nr:DUF2059 domain-containing protein [Cerasicoccus maritimus]